MVYRLLKFEASICCLKSLLDTAKIIFYFLSDLNKYRTSELKYKNETSRSLYGTNTWFEILIPNALSLWIKTSLALDTFFYFINLSIRLLPKNYKHQNYGKVEDNVICPIIISNVPLKNIKSGLIFECHCDPNVRQNSELAVLLLMQRLVLIRTRKNEFPHPF